MEALKSSKTTKIAIVANGAPLFSHRRGLSDPETARINRQRCSIVGSGARDWIDGLKR